MAFLSLPALVSPALAAELDQLNDDQRRAVRHPGNLVVRAGPGSGKTRTLVAKAGYLLDAEVSARRGVASITYTRQAAREVTSRLAGGWWQVWPPISVSSDRRGSVIAPLMTIRGRMRPGLTW